jgi:hypothetical protein
VQMECDRRNVISFVLGTLGTSICGLPAVAQLLVPVRLVVLRQPGVLSNECLAPCIRGVIYDVSHLAGFDISNIILPAVKVLPPICGVVERPYKGNQPNVSSIPRGVYKASIRNDPTKKWMKTENQRWRLELAGVPKRSAIQFHYGQDVDWSEGCFIVGTNSGVSGGLTKERYCGVEQSENAIENLRKIVTAPGRNINEITIAVGDDGDLFPNLRGAPIC